MGALRTHRRLEAITGSKFRIESYPLLARSQHIGATAVFLISLFMLVEQRDNFRPTGLLKQLRLGTVFRNVLHRTIFFYFHTFLFIAVSSENGAARVRSSSSFAESLKKE